MTTIGEMLQPRQFNNSGPGDVPGNGLFGSDGSNNNVSSQPNNSDSTLPVAVTGSVVAVVGISILLIIVYVLVRHMRLANKHPTFIPGTYLKRKYHQWQPTRKYKPMQRLEEGLPTASNVAMEYRGREDGSHPTPNTTTIDRNASVRSVMTLPPYSQDPTNTEKVLGREGERAGMDTVIEHPETADQEEANRETEMETLYQIRETRRREMAEQEERRRERRRARERGDWARLEELRQESRRRALNGDRSTGHLASDILIAEHQSRPKDRRVSSVAYAEVGHVTHDGRRLRANSSESDRAGLLDNASMMGNDRQGRNDSEASSLFTMSNLSRPTLPIAPRGRSDSGARSISSTVSSLEFPQPTPATTAEHASQSTSPEGTRDTPDSNDPPQNPTIQQRRSLPPDYDNIDWGEAPAYTEAEIRRRESQRQQIPGLPVPTISVQGASEPNSPAIGRISEEYGRFQ